MLTTILCVVRKSQLDVGSLTSCNGKRFLTVERVHEKSLICPINFITAGRTIKLSQYEILKTSTSEGFVL